jgi:hypothetical protein
MVAVLAGLGLATGGTWASRPAVCAVGGGVTLLGAAVWTYNAARGRRKAKIWGWGSSALQLPA